eukprot:6062564-Pyramimonas_sp.AAC.1
MEPLVEPPNGASTLGPWGPLWCHVRFLGPITLAPNEPPDGISDRAPRCNPLVLPLQGSHVESASEPACKPHAASPRGGR